MTWQQWFLVAYFALNALVSVAFVGRRREPITPVAAVLMVIAYALLVWLVVSIGVGA